MGNLLKVIHLAAEYRSPVITGQENRRPIQAMSGPGPANVVGQVPGKIASWGISNLVFVPRFLNAGCSYPSPLRNYSIFHHGEDKFTVELIHHNSGLSVFSLNHRLFDNYNTEPRGEGIYHPSPEIELRRSALFCIGALKALEHLKITPDVINCHDWYTALALVYLSERMSGLDPGGIIKIFTLYDVNFPGIFPYELYSVTDLPWKLYTPDAIEYHFNISLLKAGLNFANMTVVRDRGALNAFQKKEEGNGFEGVIRELFDQKRIVALTERPVDWPPSENGLSREAVEAWAGGEVNVYRYLFPEYFRGMWRSSGKVSPPLSIFRKTRTERLRATNPWLTDIYIKPDSFTRRNLSYIRRALDHGCEYLFQNTASPQDIVALMASLKRINWEDAEGTIEMLQNFAPLTVDALARDFERLPASGSAAFHALVERGRAALPSIARVTLAGGHDIHFFTHEKHLCRGLLSVGRSGSFFKLHAEDILEAQQLSNSTIPWYIMISPLAKEAIFDHFKAHNYFGLKPRQVRFIQQDLLCPALEIFNEEIRLFMDQDLKRIPLFPAGSGYLLQYMHKIKLLSSLLGQGISYLSISQIGNIAARISDEHFSAAFGFQMESKSPLLCEMVESHNKVGPYVVVSEGKTFAAAKHALPEQVLYDAQRSSTPTLTGSLLVSVPALAEITKDGVPQLLRYPKKENLGYGEFFIPTISLTDITRRMNDIPQYTEPLFLIVPPSRLIQPRYYGELEWAAQKLEPKK